MDFERLKLFRKMANGLLSYALEAFFGNTVKEKGSNMAIFLVLIILLIAFVMLLYASCEVVFLLLRNKFGTKGVKKSRALLASILFLILGYFSYKWHTNYYGEIVSFGSEESYLYASFTFLVVGIIVLFRGITVGGKDDSDVVDPIYRGNSWLLGGLVKEGLKQSVVQDILEPLLFLAFGFFLFSYNMVWGLPFMFCAISCWFHLGIESLFGFFGIRRDLSNEGLLYTQNRSKIAIQ
ncbi:MAG: hypothetical protein Sapg2KO_24690 [Saprospiraceae bacterium]